MGLEINKAKRETVADCILGFAILGFIINIGWYIYLPISTLINDGKFISFNRLYPINEEFFKPFLGFIICSFLIYFSKMLKNPKSWISDRYESNGGGTLLLIFLFSFWCIILLLVFMMNFIIMLLINT